MNLGAESSRTGTQILFGYNQLLCAASITEGGRFNLSAFEDFNRFVEAVVLYDKVVLLGEYDLPASVLYSELSKAGIFEKISDEQLRNFVAKPQTQRIFEESMCQAFGVDVLSAQDAEALALLDLRIPPNPFDRWSYSAVVDQAIKYNKGEDFDLDNFTIWLTENVFQTRGLGAHFYYIARALVYSAVAECTGMDYAPDFLRLPLAALAFARRSPPITRALYDALVEKLRSEVEALALLGMPVAMFVPPLTANMLSKAPAPQDYPTEILALRAKFAKFRRTYGEFIELLESPEVTVKDKIAAKERLFDSITGIIGRGEGQHSLNVRTIWDKVVSSQFGESEVSLKVSLSGMVSLLVEQILKEHTKGRARALFDLWTDTLNLKNYGSLIEKTFHTEIDRREIELFKKYSSAVRSIVRRRVKAS